MANSSFLISLFVPLLLLLLLPFVRPLSFNFSDFGDNAQKSITLTGNALFDSSNAPVIQLAQTLAHQEEQNNIGRAVHRDPLHLWDVDSGNLTDFVTHFTFVIEKTNNSTLPGDGLAFFLAPYPADKIPYHAGGRTLGLFDDDNDVSQVLAVEFDTFYGNEFDPRGTHVGIDVFSKKSITYALVNNFSMIRNDTAYATISYNARTMNLSVVLNYDPQVTRRSWSTSTSIDLRLYLPEKVSVGFSATTGSATEIHTILSWDFSSTLQNKKKLTRIFLDAFLGVAIFFCGVGLSLFAIWERRNRKEEGDDEELLSVDSEGMGPKSFQYEELASATNNFDHEGILGEGGFGSVYYGVLAAFNRHPAVEVAIKRISRESMQGKKCQET